MLVHVILPHLLKQVVSELEINRVVVLQKLLSLRLHPSLSLGIGEFLDFQLDLNKVIGLLRYFHERIPQKSLELHYLVLVLSRYLGIHETRRAKEGQASLAHRDHF